MAGGGASRLNAALLLFFSFRVLYEGKERLKPGWYVMETTPYSRSASLSSGGAPAAHRVFLTYRRAADAQGLHTLGITDIGLLLPSKGEAAPHTFCRVDKSLSTSMVGGGGAWLWGGGEGGACLPPAGSPASLCVQWAPALFLCYKRAVAKANALVYKPSESWPPPRPPPAPTSTIP